MPKLSERTEADTNLAGRARKWHAEGTRWAMRAEIQEPGNGWQGQRWVGWLHGGQPAQEE